MENKLRKKILLMASVIVLTPFISWVLTRLFFQSTPAFPSIYEAFSYLVCFTSAGFMVRSARLMWFVSLVLIFDNILFNLFLAIVLSDQMDPKFFVFQSGIYLILFSTCLAYILYLRKNHFDRRGQFSLIGVADRYAVNETATLKSKTKNVEISGNIKSLSFSGAYFESPSIPSELDPDGWIVSIPGVSFINQPAKIVASGSGFLRLNFDEVGIAQSWKLNEKLKKFPLEKRK